MRAKAFAAVLAMATSFALPTAALGAAGFPDPSFGSGGFTLLSEPPAPGSLSSLVILPDGRIVGGGTELSSGFLLARLNPNGTRDEGFGPGGINLVPQEGPETPRGIDALVLQGDGKIVAAGYGEGSPTDQPEFARYLPGGSLDPAFGSGGLTMMAPSSSGGALAVDLAPDQKVVATGQAGVGEPAPVFRLTASGVPDEDFNGSPAGVRFINAPGVSGEQGFAVRVLADSAILIGGFTDEGALLAKLDANGNPVPGFGSAGIAIHDLGSEPSPTGSIHDLEVLPDGRIVATGRSEAASGGSQLFVARFLAGGALDPSFAGGGIFRSDPTPELDEGNAIEALPDGRLVVAGRRGFDDSGGANVWVLRLTADGQLDPTFGNGGMFVGDRAGEDSAEDLELQPDGRAVVAGEAAGKLLFARFTADDPPPPPPPNPPRCRGRAATLTGTPNEDRLTGTPGPDVVAAFQGDDKVDTFGGNDLICAGTGKDIVRAGKGKDTAEGGAGRDLIFGGPGRDRLFGGPALDLVFGGGGSDRLAGGPGRRDLCNGGGGHDRRGGGCERRKRFP